MKKKKNQFVNKKMKKTILYVSKKQYDKSHENILTGIKKISRRNQEEFRENKEDF